MMIKKLYGFTLIAFIGLACLFHYWQNQWMVETGGAIALSKSFWLFITILYWIVMPIFVIIREDICKPIRQAYTIFLLNMLTRAILELVMMYGTHNWHHMIGVAHDLFSIALLIYFIRKIRNNLESNTVWLKTLRIMTWMFVVELGFVAYMLQTVTVAGEQIFFVPSGQSHFVILYLTWFINCILISWQLNIFRKGFISKKINQKM